ncbi:hypothetical protein [Rhizobium sp. ICMP 5592]|uniref:hypothetical protein n=1 Tax=Rhizobium sp. ICMP 5592 TaxID=2292445 RepID=UPI00256FE45C|nr:hypothetical protein [Rhizobium sp. ICMP 5592]
MYPDNATKISSPSGRTAFLGDRLSLRAIDPSLMDDHTPLFENDEWLVDDFGIQAKMAAGSFKIPARRLGEVTTSPEGTFLFWPAHLALEPWINFDLFVEAYKQALSIHVGHYGSRLPDPLLDGSIDMAAAIFADRMVATTKG